MVKRILGRVLNKLETDELKSLSDLFFDITKGILGVPLVVYLVSGYSLSVILGLFMLSLGLGISVALVAIYLQRLSKRTGKHYG